MSDDNSIKVILVGMSGTGKTNIIKALVDKPFVDENDSTLTSSFVSKSIKINKKTYNLEIWDTAGQEVYKSLTKLFIVGSKVVIFVYDITDKSSFNELDYWVKTVKDILGKTPIYAIFGNKKDLFMNEKVTEEEGENKAKEIGAHFKLTSAKTERENINIIVNDLVKEYVEREEKDNKSISNREESFALQINKEPKKKKKCCEK